MVLCKKCLTPKRGCKGFTGQTGLSITGSTGYTGATNNSQTGPTGFTGPNQLVGITGPAGPTATPPNLLTINTLLVNGTAIFNSGVFFPSGDGGSSTLNYYEEFTNSTTFSGGGGLSTAVDYSIVKLGKNCVMNLDAFSFTYGNIAPTNIISSNSNIPARFCPSSLTKVMSPLTFDSITSYLGELFITPSGTINIYKNATESSYNLGSAGLSTGAAGSYISST